MAELIYYGKLRELTGKKSESADVKTIEDALRLIGAEYGRTAGKEARRMLITVNGTGIQLLDRYRTALGSGDSVSFLPLGAGG